MEAADERIRVSVRLRPLRSDEACAHPPPWPVVAAPADRCVRLYTLRGAGTARGDRVTPRAAAGDNAAALHTSPRLATGGAVSSVPALKQLWQSLQGGGSSGVSGGTSSSCLHTAATGSEAFQEYKFAAVFDAGASSADVFTGSGARDVVDAACAGCNGTLFCYGQTGSGKTYTHEAITRAAVSLIFRRQQLEDDGRELAAVMLCVVEIYNEAIRCLLTGRDVALRQGAAGGKGVGGGGGSGNIILEGAGEQACTSEEQALALIEAAKARRAVGETRANTRSSRSHLVVRVRLEVLELGQPGADDAPGSGAGAGGTGGGADKSPTARTAPRSVAFGLLNLVDLAGSERVDKSGSSESKLQLREALNINKSLLCLGNVVNALAERAEGKKVHIPYRDSKLTRLLEDSLGGAARTALVACATPLPGYHLEQTRATLDFAARTANVVCTPRRNVLALDAPGGDAAVAVAVAAAQVAALQGEVERLRAALAGSAAEMAALRERVASHAAAGPSSSAGDMACSSGGGVGGALERLTARLSLLRSGSTSTRASTGGACGGAASAAADSAAAVAAVVAAAALARSGSADNGAAAARSARSSCASPPAAGGSIVWRALQLGRTPEAAAGSVGSGPLNCLSEASVASEGGAASVAAAAAAAISRSRHASAAGTFATMRRHLSMGGTSGTPAHDAALAGSGGSNALPVGASPGSCAAVLATRRVSDGDCAAAPGSLGTAAVASPEVRAAGAVRDAALREHIIRSLVALLQQKKGQVRALQDSVARLEAALEAAAGERAAQEARLRAMVEGLSRLTTARQEEVERWTSALGNLEAGLEAAQREAAAYRQEAADARAELAAAQASYTAQAEQLRQTSTAMLQTGQALVEAKGRNAQGLVVCMAALGSIKALLDAALGDAVGAARAGSRQSLGASAVHRAVHGGGLASGSSDSGGSSGAGSSFSLGSSAAGGGGVADEDAAVVRQQLSQLALVLPKLQALLDAHMDQVKLGAPQASATGAATPALQSPRTSTLGGAGVDTGSCGRCQLTGEVSALREALGQRDTQLAGSADAIATLRGDLAEARAGAAELQDRLVAALVARRRTATQTLSSGLAAAGDAFVGAGPDALEHPEAMGADTSVDDAGEASAGAGMLRVVGAHHVGGDAAAGVLCASVRNGASRRGAAAQGALVHGARGARSPVAHPLLSICDSDLFADGAQLQELHFQILRGWCSLSVPHVLRAAAVLHPSWSTRGGCEAHVASLACLAQLQQDESARAAAASDALAAEAAALSSGLSRMPRRELALACGALRVPSSSGGGGAGERARRVALLAGLWVADSPAAAGPVAAASAEVVLWAQRRGHGDAAATAALRSVGEFFAASAAAVLAEAAAS